MTIQLFSARRVGDDLAAGRITAADQSLYLTASFLIWIVPAYLFLFPAPRATDPHFFWSILLIELAVVVSFCITGVRLCLRKCRVDPGRHFLVDFSCLYAPISLITMAVVWAAFYLLINAVPWLLSEMKLDHDPERWLPWLASAQVHDVLRLFASAGAVLIVFLRIGKHMDRVSTLRESANNGVQPTPASGRG